ncbi:molybdopterin-dependent oxidoreductase [Paenibacillus sp. GD4]|uniref:molybdopterin-dependent oxidoreductase n=1 Tax=Paenibacillus sp. GD4 TaxID=3068890 RepID=UPI002796A472|nr:molybdopterin-dependent oxidoreductase [Paenibacillus sp. GD4]MDQ1911887.1 molybdopterin-dependent oxidoreductase [Paenibacillus sp. GD4]
MTERIKGKRIPWLGGVSYGKRLKKLHAWNAWLLVLLAVTGVLLLVPALRGTMGAGRVWLKYAHIGLGAASLLVLAAYAPLLPKHWRQLRARAGQRWNLGVVLGLLAGWGVTGLVLWQYNALPPVWANRALWLHDAFTWVGVPYAAYHAFSRSRWVKAARSSSAASGEAAAPGAALTAAGAVVAALKRSPVSRATFLRLAAGAVLVAVVGPSMYRWLKNATDTGGDATGQLRLEDGNRMVPPPDPLPASLPPAGGGAQGRFRVYTVTPIPAFSSESWQFALSGLVEKEQVWSWEQFLQLKRTVQVSDFHCITGWSVYKVTWEGILLRDLLDLAQVKDRAKYVKFYSGDKVYTDALSLEQARMDDVLVAVLMDGEPIPQKLGGPVRLIVPQMYAYKSVKWLQAIELIEKEHIGYWELRGYENDAWVKT